MYFGYKFMYWSITMLNIGMGWFKYSLVVFCKQDNFVGKCEVNTVLLKTKQNENNYIIKMASKHFSGVFGQLLYLCRYHTVAVCN